MFLLTQQGSLRHSCFVIIELIASIAVFGRLFNCFKSNFISQTLKLTSSPDHIMDNAENISKMFQTEGKSSLLLHFKIP